MTIIQRIANVERANAGQHSRAALQRFWLRGKRRCLTCSGRPSKSGAVGD
jgi:hypothetical protein